MDLLAVLPQLAQAGFAGVAILALGILYKVVTNHFNHTNEIITRSSDSNTELAESLGVHTEVIRSLKEVIERKL